MTGKSTSSDAPSQNCIQMVSPSDKRMPESSKVTVFQPQTSFHEAFPVRFSKIDYRSRSGLRHSYAGTAPP